MAYGLHCLTILLLYLCLQCNQGMARPLPEYTGQGLSEQSDLKILSPSSVIVDATSALEERTTKQTHDEQGKDSVLAFEEASGPSEGSSDDYELSREFSGDGSSFNISSEDSISRPSTGTASQTDSPSELFPPTDDTLFSDALAWAITNEDVVDQLFLSFQTFAAAEKRFEQAMAITHAEMTDSGSGASSQSDPEIVDIDRPLITALYDDEVAGSGEIEDDAAASYTDMIDRDEIAHIIPEPVPTARGDCLGQCGDSSVKTSPTDDNTESHLLVAATTTGPKTQIPPPASWSAIRDYVDSSGSGDSSALDTDALDENTPTVAETQVTFRGATVLDRQDVPAEGNSTIPVPGT
ncbi:uncharacterized protein LOC134059689 [Sardina pilchardus]|uniref:uncharacterized protein LOC134059689 n=1 Tax=Sardina pilchardus TaxID=27697 RepID=UPI002E0FFB18